MENWTKDGFLISTDRQALEIDRIHQFLSSRAYWCEGIPRVTVEAAIENSLCFGLFEDNEKKRSQIGFARVVTDFATFAWICDVYVEEPHRGRGLSKWLIECVVSHPQLQGLRRICLATKDAHGLYEQVGFKVTETPQNWLEIKINDIYKSSLRKT